MDQNDADEDVEEVKVKIGSSQREVFLRHCGQPSGILCVLTSVLNSVLSFLVTSHPGF